MVCPASCTNALEGLSHNRNEALQLARPQADYLLFIDADEQLTVPASFTWPTLTANGYYLTCRSAGVEYSAQRPH